VRRAILKRARGMTVRPDRILEAHIEREHIGDPQALLDDVEERYDLPGGTLGRQLMKRVEAIVASSQYETGMTFAIDEDKARVVVLRERGANSCSWSFPMKSS
jgi:hypothetical protein